LFRVEDDGTVNIVGTLNSTGPTLYLDGLGSGGVRVSGSLGTSQSLGAGIQGKVTDTWLNIAASTTTRSAIQMNAGVDPTSPNAGDMWFDGTNLKFYDSTTTHNLLGLDTKADKLITTNTQTASYTLVLADANKLVRMNVASANDLTIPPNSSVAFAVGTILYVEQMGAGTTTIVAGSGVTLNTTAVKTPYQYGTLTLIQVSADVWNVIGGTV